MLRPRMAFGPVTALMEGLAMKAMSRTAALAAVLALVSGCSHSMRHYNPQLKDQVKLPAAPMIEPSTSAPAGTSPVPGPGAAAPATSARPGAPLAGGPF